MLNLPRKDFYKIGNDINNIHERKKYTQGEIKNYTKALIEREKNNHRYFALYEFKKNHYRYPDENKLVGFVESKYYPNQYQGKYYIEELREKPNDYERKKIK